VTLAAGAGSSTVDHLRGCLFVAAGLAFSRDCYVWCGLQTWRKPFGLLVPGNVRCSQNGGKAPLPYKHFPHMYAATFLAVFMLPGTQRVLFKRALWDLELPVVWFSCQATQTERPRCWVLAYFLIILRTSIQPAERRGWLVTSGVLHMRAKFPTMLFPACPFSILPFFQQRTFHAYSYLAVITFRRPVLPAWRYRAADRACRLCPPFSGCRRAGVSGTLVERFWRAFCAAPLEPWLIRCCIALFGFDIYGTAAGLCCRPYSSSAVNVVALYLLFVVRWHDALQDVGVRLGGWCSNLFTLRRPAAACRRHALRLLLPVLRQTATALAVLLP